MSRSASCVPALHTVVAVFFAASALFLGLSAPDSAEGGEQAERTLRILNWSQYIDMDEKSGQSVPLAHRSPTLRAFMKKYKCEVVYDEYDTEVEMAKKIQNLPGYYDIVLATRVKSAEMAQAGLTAPLDTRHIPNLKNVFPKYRGKIGPNGKTHFAPYLVGTTGLAYREDLVGRKVTSWEDYFHPDERLKGKIGAMDTNYMLYLGLLAEGHNPDSRNTEHIREAAKLFLDLKRAGYLTLFSSDFDTLARRLRNGETAMVIMYSGDALSAAEGRPEIKYTIPEEGGEYYVDGMVLLKDAPSPGLGSAFINEILDPAVNARLAVFLNYASPVRGANKFIQHADPAHLDNPAINIPPEIMNRLHVFTDADAEAIRRMWRKIMK